MANKNPKVLVGCPTSSHKEYCLKKYADAVKDLTYKNYDILLVDNSKDESYAKKIKELGLPVIKTPYSEYAKDRVITARNLLRERALEGKYDYLFSLEQDVIPPKNIIEGLLRHKKEVVSGVVYHFFPKRKENKEAQEWIEKPMLAIKSQKTPGKLAFLSSDQIKDINAFIEVDYCSMGCLMISRKILEKVKFRYEEYKEANKENPEDVKWDDMCFCSDVQKLGKKIYADLGAKCGHLVLGGYSITLGDTSKVSVISKSISLKDITKD